MRLLLRANSHRAVSSGAVEIAAAPDTPGREHWQWHLRLEDAETPEPAGTRRATVALGDDSTTRLALCYDPDVVEPECGSVDLGPVGELTRGEGELMALVVGKGTVLVEGRHRLAARDCLVLEGDDPTKVSVERAAEEDAALAVFRLKPTGQRGLGWIP
jgi:hypothetical protein